MLDRIEMDVVDVIFKIAFITQQVLPVAVLPYILECRVFAEPRLDQPPARHEIGIAIRQGPDAVQMVGQDNDGVDIERPRFSNYAKRLAQQADSIC